MKNEKDGHLQTAIPARRRANASSEVASRTPAKLQANSKTAGQSKLSKSETVALWHAVRWMDTVLREWKREGFRDEQDQAQHEVERQRFTDAKRALRKVNQIREEQAA